MASLEEKLALMTERAENAESELDSYKKEAKEMEEFLEGEATKKEAQIRKLKEQFIMKEKDFKAQKAELTQLQAKNAALKEQIATTENSSKADVTLTAKFEEQIQTLKKSIEALTKQLEKEKESAAAQQNINKSKQEEWQNIQQGLKQEIDLLNKRNEQLNNLNNTLNEKLNSSVKVEQKPQKEAELQRKSSKKEIKFASSNIEKDRYEDKIRQLQESNRKLQLSLIQSERMMKQLKMKTYALQQQNQTLHGKILAYSSMHVTSQSSFHSPFTIKSTIEQQDYSFNRINYSCLLLTKSHYISPFLEIVQDKSMLKIYKSTRTGTFQKSVGSSKHKFDVLTYDQDQIIDPIIKSITESQEINSHSIVLYGVKKSNKKYLMSKILVKLKEFLIAKLENSEESSSIFLKRSLEEEKNSTDQGNDMTSILDVIDKVISLGQKSEKPKQKYPTAKKTQSKPKIRYFNFKAEDFYLEIGTSSYTNLTFRDKMTSTNMLNNILFSKLPDILQSSISQKYLILTLNPIVDLYEDCKNTLSTTICRAAQPKQDFQARDWRSSPIKEQLNDAAKKKLEGFERENEQTSIKIRKLEQECLYFKSRFDELQFRLKNLLNTHAGQNSYLKKSPITLSYEKLLKFVHSVQSRTVSSTTPSQYGSTSMLLKGSHLNTEKQDMDAL